MAVDRLQELQSLLSDHAISGYSLISHTGCVELAYGDLEDELWPSKDTESIPNTLVQHILATFRGAPPSHFDVASKRLVVVRQEDSYVYAVAKQCQLGISLHYLNTGILVVSYKGRQQMANVGHLHETL